MDHRHGLELALLWLWHRLAAAAPIRPLAWEPSYAVGAALKKRQKTKKKKKNKREISKTQNDFELSEYHTRSKKTVG